MKQRCVLLADGHQRVFESHKDLLEDIFNAVLIVSNEDSLYEALAKVDPDIVIVDLSLPISGEVNIVRRLKRRFLEAKLIILSVHDEPVVVQEVMAAGAEGFVLKRSAATDLIPAVQAVLAGKLYMSPSLKGNDDI